MFVAYYPTNKDAFRVGDIVSWAKRNKLDYVVELHRNSATSSSANGAEIWIKSGYGASKYDKALYSATLAMGYTPRGIKKTNGLANVNRMALSGIDYALWEGGFIKNSRDNKIFDDVRKQSTLLYNQLSKSGVKRLGIVYGHGGSPYDPGATNGSRQEAKDVRRIKLDGGSGSTPTPTKPNKPIQKDVIDIKANKIPWDLGVIGFAGDRYGYTGIPRTIAEAKKPKYKLKKNGNNRVIGNYTHATYKGVDMSGRKVPYTIVTVGNTNIFVPFYRASDIKKGLYNATPDKVMFYETKYDI